MKLNFTFSIFLLCVGGFFFLSNSAGRAGSEQAGNTGAPGETAVTCVTCHGSSTSFGTSVDLTLLDADGTVVNEYIPGELYTFVATINTVNAPAGYGLQMVSLLSDNSDSEGLSNPSDNANIVPLNGRNYLEQKTLSSSEIFSADWQAPAAASGPVTFYASGHAANGNGATSGDEADNTVLMIEEQAVAVDIYQELGVTLSPNPVNDFARLNLDSNINGSYKLYNIAGKIISQSIFSGDAVEIDMTGQDAGFYFIKVSDDKNLAFQTLKFIKN